MREIKFEDLRNHPRNPSYRGKRNLDLAEKGKKFSYFNLNKKYIRIEILTSNKDFKLKNIFYTLHNTEKYIIVHISDNTPLATRGLTPLYLMNIKEEMTDIKNCTSNTISISEDDEVKVVVFNDDKSMSCSNLDEIIISYLREKNSSEKDLIQPSESGGGIIVKGP